MRIFTLKTIAASLRATRCCRWQRYLAAVTIVVSAAGHHAAAAAESPETPAGPVAVRASDATPPSPKKSDPARGRVFCNGIRLQDEIAVVNTRNICGCCDPEAIRTGIKVENYAVGDDSGSRRWQPSDLQSLLAFKPAVPTVVFVHGNQISSGDAKCEGLAVYRHLILHGSDAPPIRFVIFSWPSTQVSGLLRDVRVKASRTGPAGCQLAWLLDQMPAETPLSLVGFSFGARLITGGLHVLAGGSLNGSASLAENVHPNRPPVSVILMASAVHSYWLAEGQYHGMAMTQVSRMMLINNCNDPAMKYYDFLEPGHGGPQALGLCGPTRIGREYAKKIMNRDVSRYVGADHELMSYLCAPGDAGLIWDYTTGAPTINAKTGD